MNEHTETIDKFITTVFDKTLTADIKHMLCNPDGMDFAIIMLVFSGIDLIGALDQGNLKNPETRFKVALERYFPERYGKYKDILFDYFRCGVAHQAFIKPGTATARNKDYINYHLYGVIVEGVELFFIQPNMLADDFFKAIEIFKDSLI